MIFFAPGTLVDPPLAPTVRGLAGPPAAPSDHWYGGLRVSLGESEAWKPQNVGGCGWTRCPRNSLLSHVAQDTARSWFRGAGAHCAVFGAFWRLFGPFLGHIVELEGTEGPLVTRKASRTCMNEPSAQIQHATNDFCIAPRLAESGAHSMDGLITPDFLMKEPSAQVQHATNDFCIAPRLAESGAHSMEDLITLNFSMKEPSAQVQHATNDFCIAPRLAESGAHSMEDLVSPDFSMKEPSDFLMVAIFHGPKCITTGSKWAKNTCLSIQRGLGSLLEKRVFDPFLTHFWS